MSLENQFKEIVESHKGVIYKACYVYADKQEYIDDLYQEVLINIWRGLPKFRNDSNISTWIYRISINTCFTFLRKKKNKPPQVSLSFDLSVFDESDEKRRQIDELNAIINRLGKLERTIIWLWLEDKNYDEIAEITGLSKANVGVKLMRIKNKIKIMFNE